MIYGNCCSALAFGKGLDAQSEFLRMQILRSTTTPDSELMAKDLEMVQKERSLLRPLIDKFEELLLMNKFINNLNLNVDD